MAAAHDRPLAEAVLGYSSKNKVAAVTLRASMLPKERNTLETAWLYDLAEIRGVPETTWDVIEGIQVNGRAGVPIANRSGVVVLTAQREGAQNWAVSYPHDPDMIATEIHDVLTAQIDYFRF